jgi:hypothetical protein
VVEVRSGLRPVASGSPLPAAPKTFQSESISVSVKSEPKVFAWKCRPAGDVSARPAFGPLGDEVGCV